MNKQSSGLRWSLFSNSSSSTLLSIPGTIALLTIIFMSLAAESASAQNERIARNSCIYVDGWVCFMSVENDSKVLFLGNGGGPAWSPDGSRIAFSDFIRGIFILNLQNWSVVNVSSIGFAPAWSPDGSRIAFEAGEMYVMNADGSNVVRLTNNVGFRGQPAWSSDGTTIAFTCALGTGYYDICAINMDGTGFRRLTFDPGNHFAPRYSPDGSLIAFVNEARIAVMNPDGTGIRNVGEDIYAFNPTWSPDGSQIAFSTGGCELSGECPDTIYVMNRDGSGLRSMGYGNNPSWGPSVRPIASFSVGECNGLDCPFDASDSWPGASPIMSYIWNFADGTPRSGLTANYTFAAAGTHPVTLTVTDDAGFTATRRRDINVTGNIWPVPRFTYECTRWQCTFDASTSSDADGSIVSYTFGFGDGRFATGSVVTNAYQSAGPFTVTLYVSDDAGVTRSQQQVITLAANQHPVASFTVNCTRLTCTFDGSGSSDPDGSIVSYSWSILGSTGPVASSSVVTHTFATPGDKYVSFFVTDDFGAISGLSRSVVVVQEMHIGDLDAVRTSQRNTWAASVTIIVHDGDHLPIPNATVSASWSFGGSAMCTTNVSGQCQMSTSGFARNGQSIQLDIVSVAGPLYYSYTPAINHDPDGDSTGSSITITRP